MSLEKKILLGIATVGIAAGLTGCSRSQYRATMDLNNDGYADHVSAYPTRNAWNDASGKTMVDVEVSCVHKHKESRGRILDRLIGPRIVKIPTYEKLKPIFINGDFEKNPQISLDDDAKYPNIIVSDPQGRKVAIIRNYGQGPNGKLRLQSYGVKMLAGTDKAPVVLGEYDASAKP